MAKRRTAAVESDDWLAAEGLARRRGRWSVYFQMADLIPAAECGKARIEHFTVGREPQLRAALHPGEYVPPGDYCRLFVDGCLYMSDTPMEQSTNADAVTAARGDVLIGGLGVGLIVLPILAKPNVTSVTVIEKAPDVITLVEPNLRRWQARSAQTGQLFTAKLNWVQQGDVRTWEPAKPGRQFDFVYMDVWANLCTDYVADMQALHRRYRRWTRPGGKVISWQYEHLRDLKSRGRWR